MKQRTGFVSNSSSSSFIISKDKDSSASIQITLDVDLTDFAEHIISTEEELNSYFLDERVVSLSDLVKESEKVDSLYSQCKREIGKGNQVIVVEVDNSSNSPLRTHLHYNGLPLDKLPDKMLILEDNHNV